MAAAIAIVVATVALAMSVATAVASTATEIASLSTLDSLQRSEAHLSNGGKWAAASWATDEFSLTGSASGEGWSPSEAYPEVSAPYWSESSFSERSAAAVTLADGPDNMSRYVALWLDMPSPSTAKSGYELTLTVVPAGGSEYNVKLSKWSAGSETVLASASAVTVADGTTLAISDTGSTVTAWEGSGGSLSSTLSAADSTFSSGYAGIDGSGNRTLLTNFKAGHLPGTAPGKPTVSGTSPASPANDNSPKVIGSADAGSTVGLFTNSSCSGSPAATGSAATFASPGIAVSVSDNTSTTFYATASNEAGASACSTTSVSYVEDSKAPPAPTFSWTAPVSPAKSTAPKIAGSAESGSTVKLYANGTCTGSPAVTGSAASFAAPGLATSVAENASATYHATATDAAGNTSSCSGGSITYKNDAENILFEGSRLADFAELQQCEPGRITEVPDPLGSGKTVLSFLVKDTDVNSNAECNKALTPTNNPRATALSKDFVESGDEFWLRTRFLIPESFPTIQEWLSMFSIWGEPYLDTSPWHFEITTLDGFEGDFFTYQRNSSYGYDIPWSAPRLSGSWVEVLTHEKFATNGFVEEWLNGKQIEFFTEEVSPYNPNGELPAKKLEMETMDFSNDGHSNSLRIGQYRKAGSFEAAPIYYEFVKVGKTKAAVGG